MPKPLTVQLLQKEASSFAKAQSKHGEPSLFGVTDGKAVGTYVELKFRKRLADRYAFAQGSAAKGIDFPGLGVDVKVTSIRQPQSSCPYNSARQKIFGLGYALLVFVYEKTDDAAAKTGRLNILHVVFVEARRILKSGGGVLVAGREPPSEADRWWVYEYFEETRAIDRARYPTGATIQAEMAAAGFVRCITSEADHLHEAILARTALETGVVDRRFTSQLSVLSDAQFNRGVRRLRDAMDAAKAAGGELMLAADVRFEATIGWVP